MSTDPNAETVVRAIVDLARSLRLDVVAEGVETTEDAEVLRAIGCVTGQGYLFSRPLTAAAMTAWLEEAEGSIALTSRRGRSWRARTAPAREPEITLRALGTACRFRSCTAAGGSRGSSPS